MTVTQKDKGTNLFSLNGLTSGKLLAIQNSLEKLQAMDNLSPVAYDVMVFLQRENKRIDDELYGNIHPK